MKRDKIKALIEHWIPKNYDRIRNTKECPHCNQTGRAPSSDGRTPCGFCDPSVPLENPDNRRFDVV